jgi:hypothetical protein
VQVVVAAKKRKYLRHTFVCRRAQGRVRAVLWLILERASPRTAWRAPSSRRGFPTGRRVRRENAASNGLRREGDASKKASTVSPECAGLSLERHGEFSRRRAPAESAPRTCDLHSTRRATARTADSMQRAAPLHHCTTAPLHRSTAAPPMQGNGPAAAAPHQRPQARWLHRARQEEHGPVARRPITPLLVPSFVPSLEAGRDAPSLRPAPSAPSAPSSPSSRSPRPCRIGCVMGAPAIVPRATAPNRERARRPTRGCPVPQPLFRALESGGAEDIRGEGYEVRGGGDDSLSLVPAGQTPLGLAQPVYRQRRANTACCDH